MNLVEWYFRPKQWEGQGILYEMMGVLLFKALVVKLGRVLVQDPSKENSYYLWRKDTAGIQAYERRTRYSELIHLAGMLPIAVALLRGGNGSAVQIVVSFFLMINVYAILLQRYNRRFLVRICAS